MTGSGVEAALFDALGKTTGRTVGELMGLKQTSPCPGFYTSALNTVCNRVLVKAVNSIIRFR